MRVLVTGGFGYLGAHIATSLADAGHDVTLLELRRRPEREEWASRFRVLFADVSDAAQIAGCCQDVDAVVHTAALNAAASAADEHAALEVTGWGTRNMLDESLRAGVGRFVYLSTFHVYGPPRAGLIDESVPAHPVHPYSVTHHLAETYCFQYAARGVDAVVLRLSNGYGAPVHSDADCWTLAVNDFARQAVRDGRIVLATEGRQLRDFVAVSDIAAAARMVVEGAGEAGAVYQIGSGRALSVREVAETVARVAAEETGRVIEVAVEPGARPAEEPVEFTYDVSRARSIGWEPAARMVSEVRGLVTALRAWG